MLDKPGDRALTDYKGRFSFEKCYELCIGYKYFNRQAEQECWCGNGDDYKRHGIGDNCLCDDIDNIGSWRGCFYQIVKHTAVPTPTTSAPTTTAPTTMAPTTMAPTTIAPTALKDPCVNVKKSRCRKECVFTRKPKKIKVCLVKKLKYEHDCAQYTQRTPCREVDVCKFANGKCFHGCDGLAKKKCLNTQFCKPAKVANPCLGCQLVTMCGLSR